jgi:pilus assembly protein FimV
MRARALTPLALAAALAACSGPAPAPAPPKAATPAPAPAAKPATPAAPVAATTPVPPSPGTAAAASAQAALTPSAPSYEAAGRRDPFESLESRLGSDRASVANAKLTGVIHSGAMPLALVETSDGIGYILKPGDTLADGRLIEIGPSVAVFSIAPKPGTTNNRVVLKLASD